MNKDSGFTLVELLAVVMVIGLVALVSVPVVRNITKDAKQKGKERQIGIVLESAKNWAIQNTDLLPENNGSILVKTDTLKKEGLLENKKIINPVNNKEINGCAKISYNEDFNQYEYEYNEECKSSDGPLSQLATISTELYISSVASCAKDGTTCSPGTEFAIKVNDKETYKFYVISDTNNKVTMIMDRNLGETVAWISVDDYVKASTENTNCEGDACNDKGPITALNYLNDQTSNWTNIPLITNYIYDNNLNGTTNAYGYQKLEIINGVTILTNQDGTEINTLSRTSRTRILSAKDTNEIVNANNKTMPIWMYTNLSDSNTETASFGYWLLTTHPSVFYRARDVRFNGYAGYDTIIFDDRSRGIRPVIELSKLATIY